MDKSSVIHRLLASKDLLTFGEVEIKERIYELVVKSAEYGDQTDKLVNEIISFYSKGGEGDPAKYLNDYTEVSSISSSCYLIIYCSVCKRHSFQPGSC